jgi:DNA-binding response OmpR family regulator
LHATNGQEALDYLDLLKSEIDIVIVRPDLSVVSGLHVIWRLVKRKQPKPPWIIATASMDDVPLLKHVVQELGADTVVRVPTSLKDLRKQIREVLSACSKGKGLSATAGA